MLEEYIQTLMPCVYDDFIGTAREIMEERNHQQLRHLLNFKFKKNSRCNLPDRRLKMIEKQIQKRARALLGE